MKKVDIVGIVIYTGLAGVVLGLVGMLLWAILRGIIFGA